MNIYILSGNYKEYSDYVADQPDKFKRKFKYIQNISTIRGLHGIDITIVGTGMSRADIGQIMDYATLAQARVDYD